MTQRGRWARSWAVGDRGAHNLLPSGVPAGVIGCADPRPAGVSGASILASRSGFRFGGQSVGSLMENTVVAGGQARPWAGTEYVGDAPARSRADGSGRPRPSREPSRARARPPPPCTSPRGTAATTAPRIANTAPGAPPPPREPLPSPGNPATLPGNRRHRLGTAAARREPPPPPPPPPPRERPTTRNVATAPVPAGAGPIGDYLRPRALERKFVDFFRGSGLWSVSRLRSLLDEFSATVASSA